MKDYQDKYIWIIGASSGIGRALAHELANRGATLTLSARNRSALEELAMELEGAHRVISLDVADTDSVLNASRSINSVFPRLDSVIFMAGIYQPMTLDNLDMDSLQQLVEINLVGAFNVVHAVLPILSAQKNGQIALCGSVSGYTGLPNGQPYSATKAAIINLAESLRAETRNKGIDVKLINPGFVKTPMTELNNFSMPMIIEPEDAANIIATQLQSNRFEIHFPKKFSCIMKILTFLPYNLYFYLMTKLDR
ncbi:MAG: SDR family NAD(P)-dependent oxidoreductase [Gammaproteobacteria bacterium]